MSEKQKYVAYYRVSTAKQGSSGLGLQAQKEMINNFVNGNSWQCLQEFTEVESGKKSNRPQLQMALDFCSVHKCKLVIAKLDRLSRNLHFISGLLESKVDFVCADFPQANTVTIGILAVIAEFERKMISERTKAALAQAKKNGKTLGNPNWALTIGKARLAYQNKTLTFNQHIYEIIEQIRGAGITTLQGIADVLNTRGIPTTRGKKFHATTVRNICRMVEV